MRPRNGNFSPRSAISSPLNFNRRQRSISRNMNPMHLPGLSLTISQRTIGFGFSPSNRLSSMSAYSSLPSLLAMRLYSIKVISSLCPAKVFPPYLCHTYHKLMCHSMPSNSTFIDGQLFGYHHFPCPPLWYQGSAILPSSSLQTSHEDG
jgi:hypothetical protein